MYQRDTSGGGNFKFLAIAEKRKIFTASTSCRKAFLSVPDRASWNIPTHQLIIRKIISAMLWITMSLRSGQRHTGRRRTIIRSMRIVFPNCSGLKKRAAELFWLPIPPDIFLRPENFMSQRLRISQKMKMFLERFRSTGFLRVISAEQIFFMRMVTRDTCALRSGCRTMTATFWMSIRNEASTV